MHRRSVAVVGPGDGATPDDRATAYEVGRLLAEHGVVVLTGGLGGVMAAAAEGAAAAGGTSVALLPGTDRGAANPHSTVVIPTGLGEIRNAVLIRAADGVIAVGGSWGTLSEIALAERGGVPVVAVRGWTMHAADGTPVPHEQADTAAEAVRLLLARL